MTPDRKKLVAKFISDYSFEDIEPMLRKALDSDLLSGRKDGGCYISFNWLFTPKNYEPLMEGTFDNPTIAASAEKKPSKPQQKKTPSPPSSDGSLSIGERWKLAQQSQQSAEAYRDKVNRSIILGHIDNLKSIRKTNKPCSRSKDSIGAELFSVWASTGPHLWKRKRKTFSTWTIRHKTISSPSSATKCKHKVTIQKFQKLWTNKN